MYHSLSDFSRTIVIETHVCELNGNNTLVDKSKKAMFYIRFIFLVWVFPFWIALHRVLRLILHNLSECVTITVLSLPILATERGSGCMCSFINFVLSIAAGVISNFISKWLDR